MLNIMTCLKCGETMAYPADKVEPWKCAKCGHQKGRFLEIRNVRSCRKYPMVKGAKHDEKT